MTEELRFVSLQFNLELFYGYDIFREYRKCWTESDPGLANELKDLIQRDNDIFTLCRINEIIYSLCVKLLLIKPESEESKMINWQKYDKVFDYIRKYGDASTSVAFLAELMGMRSNVFSRNFTRDIGMPPKDFLINVLTSKASELLLAPNASVRETAFALQFSSEYYFSNFYKRQTGMSPREFQRKNWVK